MIIFLALVLIILMILIGGRIDLIYDAFFPPSFFHCKDLLIILYFSTFDLNKNYVS